MAIVTFIQQRGFRRWYERELVRSHSHLLLLLLCALAVIGALEGLSQAQGASRIALAACLLIAAGLGAWALRRYLFLLMRAELLAGQAACPQCSAYGRWGVEQHQVDAQGVRMAVCCRACSHRWRIAC